MILVDTSVWIEYFNGERNAHTNYLDDILGVELVGLGDITLVQVLRGFRTHAHYRSAKAHLLALPVYDILGSHRAVQAADNHRFLRSKSITIRRMLDTLIATFCIEQRFPLLFTDRAFTPFVTHLGLEPAVSEL